jgi:hypothetical protein
MKIGSRVPRHNLDASSPPLRCTLPRRFHSTQKAQGVSNCQVRFFFSQLSFATNMQHNVAGARDSIFRKKQEIDCLQHSSAYHRSAMHFRMPTSCKTIAKKASEQSVTVERTVWCIGTCTCEKKCFLVQRFPAARYATACPGIGRPVSRSRDDWSRWPCKTIAMKASGQSVRVEPTPWPSPASRRFGITSTRLGAIATGSHRRPGSPLMSADPCRPIQRASHACNHVRPPDGRFSAAPKGRQ